MPQKFAANFRNICVNLSRSPLFSTETRIYRPMKHQVYGFSHCHSYELAPHRPILWSDSDCERVLQVPREKSPLNAPVDTAHFDRFPSAIRPIAIPVHPIDCDRFRLLTDMIQKLNSTTWNWNYPRECSSMNCSRISGKCADIRLPILQSAHVHRPLPFCLCAVHPFAFWRSTHSDCRSSRRTFARRSSRSRLRRRVGRRPSAESRDRPVGPVDRTSARGSRCSWQQAAAAPKSLQWKRTMDGNGKWNGAADSIRSVAESWKQQRNLNPEN